MKKIIGLLVLAILASCEEKDLTSDNPAPDPENTILATSFIYDQKGIHPDSVLVNNLGYGFFITDVQLVVNHFFFVEDNDTIIERTEPFIVSLKETDQALVYMEPGGYSGSFGIKLGLDSAASAEISASTLPAGNELKNSDVFRLNKNSPGIDHVIIKGRLKNPDEPLDSIGTIPFEYRLGTEATTIVKTSLRQNFSLMRNSKVKFIMEVDIEPIFNDLNIKQRPFVVTDPTIPVDFATAVDMADSLKIGLF